MKHRHLIVLTIAVAIAGACGERAEPADPENLLVSEEEPGLLDLAAISAEAAIDIATGRVTGRIVEAEIEREDGTLVYSFEIEVPGEAGITEVVVDAQTGEILEVDHEEDGDEHEDADDHDDDEDEDEHDDDEDDDERGN